MNTRKGSSAMVESALMVTIAIVLAFAGMYMPFLGFASTLIPVPFIIIGVKHGLKYNITAVVAASILISIFSDILTASGMIVMVGFISTAMSYMIRKKYSFNRVIFFSTLSSIVALIIIVAIVFSFGGVNIPERFEEAVKLSNEINKDVFTKLGLDSEQLEEGMKQQAMLMDRMLMLIPVIIVCALTMNVLINYVLVAGILRRMKHYIERPTKLSYFRLPQNFFMGTIVIMVLTYFIQFVEFVKYDALVVNIVTIFSIIYLVQGLAVLSYFIEKRGIKNALRRTILVLVFLMPVFSSLLPYVGLVDVVLNIRKLEN